MNKIKIPIYEITSRITKKLWKHFSKKIKTDKNKIKIIDKVSNELIKHHINLFLKNCLKIRKINWAILIVYFLIIRQSCKGKEWHRKHNIIGRVKNILCQEKKS